MKSMEQWRADLYYDSVLYHHGIKGQKWGVRRYQNPDGSLTNAGKRKYNRDSAFNEYSKSWGNRGLKSKIKNSVKQAGFNAAYNKKTGRIRTRRQIALREVSMALGKSFLVGTASSTLLGSLTSSGKMDIETAKAVNKFVNDAANAAIGVHSTTRIAAGISQRERVAAANRRARSNK